MAIKIIEFKKKKDYESWLEKMGDKIRIINVNTTKRLGMAMMFGALGDALGNTITYTVTYEEVK